MREARVDRARKVLEVEAEAVRGVARRLDDAFARAVDTLLTCRGKVVVIGMGKSGIVCRKIAATLASTGTPAFFLHAVEAAHGDLGMLVRGDCAIVVSNSGETAEVLRLLPPMKRLGLPLIVMTGSPGSTLAAAADVVLDVGVEEEACPLGLAPTASTTATQALGDALAVVLLEERGFGPEEFAERHPGGALGRRLLRVADLMHGGDELPVVRLETPLRETVAEMTRKRFGVAAVCDEVGGLLGVITDGDLRRGLERAADIRELQARHLMTSRPKTIAARALAAEAVAMMEAHAITSLFILTDGSRRLVGLLHLHDLLRAGVF